MLCVSRGLQEGKYTSQEQLGNVVKGIPNNAIVTRKETLRGGNYLGDDFNRNKDSIIQWMK